MYISELYSGYISGIPVESRPLPGFTGWDCSDYMCPFGSNPHHKRYNSDAATGFMISQGGDQLERQRVRCQLSGDSSLGFHLQFFGRTTEYSTLQSKLITIDMKEKEIREAIEGGVHGLWNVSISFPLSDSDGILTACDSSTSIHRGYWEITFESEVGDIPAMSVVEDSYNGGLVQIMEVVKGNKMRRECSGETGYCDRTTGELNVMLNVA